MQGGQDGAKVLSSLSRFPVWEAGLDQNYTHMKSGTMESCELNTLDGDKQDAFFYHSKFIMINELFLFDL